MAKENDGLIDNIADEVGKTTIKTLIGGVVIGIIKWLCSGNSDSKQ